jgi:hypothetical protein
VSNKRQESTLSALLRDKPKRGRPRHAVSRQNVYVALSGEQKQQMTQLAEKLPPGLSRADVPDLSITVLVARFEAMRRAVSGRTREIPEGITDMNSLYLLWDLAVPGRNEEIKWTSIRVSPQQAIELGRIHGALNALFGANRSEVFALGVALLDYCVENDLPEQANISLADMRDVVNKIYL